MIILSLGIFVEFSLVFLFLGFYEFADIYLINLNFLGIFQDFKN